MSVLCLQLVTVPPNGQKHAASLCLFRKPESESYSICLQVHMKEVMSAVWLQGLDISYLREQVGKN